MAKKKEILEELIVEASASIEEVLPQVKSPIALEIEKLRAIGFDDNRIAARLMINVEKINDYK